MSRFAARSEPQIDGDVEGDLSDILSAIANRGILFDAVYLVGGFGRGEGTVRFDGKRWRAVNDYDLFVVVRDSGEVRGALKELSKELAARLSVDFVDIGWKQRDMLPFLRPTIQDYDLKYGSMLLAGTDVLGEAPSFESHDVPPYEFVRLLCNRCAGLLSVMRDGAHTSCEYRVNQKIKALIAVGDVAAFLTHGYHLHYRTRAKQFEAMVGLGCLPFDLPVGGAQAVEDAYAAKLEGDVRCTFAVDSEVLRQSIKAAYCAIAASCVGVRCRSIVSAERRLVQHYYKGQTGLQRVKDILRACRHRNPHLFMDPAYPVLFAQPCFYCGPRINTLLSSLMYVKRFFYLPGALRRPWSASSAQQLWEVYCH